MSSKAWPFAQGHVKALACHLKGWRDGVGWMERYIDGYTDRNNRI